jgi:predicted ATPase
VSDHGDPGTALVSHIRDRRLLLLVDNCDHLVGPCGRFVERLLAGAPRLQVLATSREPLNLPGEHVLVVPPLSLADDADGAEGADDAAEAGDAGDGRATVEVPGEAAGETPGGAGTGCEALRLFHERASAAIGGAAAAALPPDRALELCRRLEGIPLAIELAAVRLRALSLEDLLGRLDHRFEMLDAPIGYPSRHPTLRAAMDWSYRLCSPPEQLLWRRLSVFAGSFELDAATFVGGDLAGGAPVDVLLGLVDKSVVTREHGGPTTRYRLLEPIRQHGADLLAEHEDPAAVQGRHAEWFGGRAARFEAASCSAEQRGGLRRMRSDYPEVRAALEYTLGTPDGLRLVTDLRSYWIVRSQLGEARRWLDRALAAGLPPSPERNTALWLAAAVAVLQGDAASARARSREGEVAATAAGDRQALAYLGYVRGAAALVDGDMARARAELHGAHGVLSTVADPDAMAMSSWFMLPLVELLSGDVQAALALCKQGGDVSQARGESWALSCIHWVAGLAHLAAGDVGSAVGAARRALALKIELDDPLGITITVEQLAWLAGVRGDHTAAATLLGAATRLWSPIGRPWFGFDGLLALRGRCADAARDALGEDGFDRAYRDGGRLSTPEATRHALATSA